MDGNADVDVDGDARSSHAPAPVAAPLASARAPAPGAPGNPIRSRLRRWAVPGALLSAALGVHTALEQSVSSLENVPHLPVATVALSFGIVRVILGPLLQGWMWRRESPPRAYLKLVVAILGLGLLVMVAWGPLLRTPYNFGLYLVTAIVWTLLAVLLGSVAALLLARTLHRLETRGALSQDLSARGRFRRLLLGAVCLGAVLIGLARLVRPDPGDAPDAQAVGGDKDSQRLEILFLGNSLTAGHHLPGLLEALSQASGVPPFIHATARVPGGASLEMHRDRADVQDLLETGRFDHLVLQENSRFSVHSPERTLAAGMDLAERAGVRGTKPLWFSFIPPTYYLYEVPTFNQGWIQPLRRLGFELGGYASRGEAILYDEPQAPGAAALDPRLWLEAHRLLGERSGIPVLPVGGAALEAREVLPELPLLVEDGVHPTVAGAYLSALLLYATLLERSPEGLPGQLEVQDAGGNPFSVELEPDQAAILQRLAWKHARLPGAPPLPAQSLQTADSAYLAEALWRQLDAQELAAAARARYRALGGVGRIGR